MDVGDREVGARLVGSSTKLASNNHALDSPGRIPELAMHEERHTRVGGLEGVLVAKLRVQGDHVEIVLHALVVAERRAFLHTDHMPRAVEMTCQQARVRTPKGSGIPGKKLWSV